MPSDLPPQRAKRVLIVDDEPDLLRSIGMRLQRAGYEVLMATDSVMATQLAVSKRPDAIVLDIGLPGGDGHTVARRLRENVNTLAIPVIFVTARAGKDDIIKAQSEGAHGYLVKPYEPSELLALVKSATTGNLHPEGKMFVSDVSAWS